MDSSELTGETWRRCDGPGVAWKDVAWPGRTWHRRERPTDDGRGLLATGEAYWRRERPTGDDRDVSTPRRKRRGVVGRDMASSQWTGLHCDGRGFVTMNKLR